MVMAALRWVQRAQQNERKGACSDVLLLFSRTGIWQCRTSAVRRDMIMIG